MAGISLGSSFRLTSPIPLLTNAVFTDRTQRLAAGQLRNTSWDYHQQDTATYWRIKPLAQCFLADGTTLTTQFGTWGTLDIHWTQGSGGVGTQGPAGPTGAAGADSTVVGPTGAAGIDGATIRYYAAAPAGVDGKLRDMAINTTNGDIYEKTGTAEWTLRGRLMTSTAGGSAGVTTFNARTGAVALTSADVLAVVNRANQLAGGLQSAISKAAMVAIPASLRDYGMTVAVYADTTVTSNGRYDLATDLLTWVKQGTDVTGQFLPYNAAAPYSTASAYVTYPDSVTSALRIFHCLAFPPGAIQPTPVNGSNVLSGSWEEISPSAVAVRVPLYNVTGQNTDSAMTQKATSDALAMVSGAIQARFNNGTLASYATAQLAASALISGGGGTIISQVDIEGPLTLSGNVSLYAPGRKIYLQQNVGGDTLTLQYCSGTVECQLIERSTSGTGYALVVNNSTVIIRANVYNTQGYNAIFNQGSTMDFTGNAELTDNPELAVAGERIAVLSVGGRLTYRGIITLNAATNTSIMEGLTSFSGADVDFNGTIRVTNRGRAGRNQNGTMRLRGTVQTRDQGFSITNGKTDIYLSIDTRDAVSPTSANAALVISVNSVNPSDFYVTLHAGSELLTPAGIPSIVNGNPGYGVPVQVAGLLNQTNPPDSNITLKYLTASTMDTFSVLPYAASIAVDFNTESVRALAATGPVAYGASLNVALLKTKRHYITNTTGTDQPLSFPADWKFAPSRPNMLAAGKEAILTLECLGTTDATIKAAYAVLN